ncbi:MAG: hypothetical protein OEX02_19300, partial [Cyclobacteriaceae bacterium]|nr:hypothetical protein [Cyclobacteriaceae bacterium]
MRQIIKSISFSLLFCLVTIGSAFTQQTEKKSVNLGLQYFKLSTGKQYLKVSANVRINKKLLPVADTEVGVYTMEASASGKLGNIITNVDGEGEFVLPNGFRLHSDSTPAMTFIAVINEDHLLESTETQITVSEVELTVKFIDEDSIKWVNVMVSQPDTASGSIPVSDEEIKFFVNRPFGELPIGGD